MTTWLNDTFTEAATTALTSHTADAGSSWAYCSGLATAPNVYAILGGVLGNGGNGYQVYRNTVTPLSADQIITGVFNYQSSGFGSIGLLARLNSAGTAGYLAAYLGGATQKWGIFRIGAAGATTQIGALSASTVYSTGNTPTAVLDVSGVGATVTLDLKVDGVSVVTTTDSDALRVVATGSAGVWFSMTSGAGTGMFINSMTAADAAVAGATVSYAAPLAGQIAPLSAGTTGTATITATGTYTGTAPDQWRMVPDGSSTSVSGFDWQAFSVAPSAGAFSQTITSVPKLAGWYNVQVRDSAVPATTFATGKVGAGALVVVDGQSNAWLWFSATAYAGDSTLTPNALLRVTGKQASNTWIAPNPATMNAAIACGNALVSALGCPVGLIDGSWDASGLTIAGGAGASGSGGQWVPTATNAYGSSHTAITAAGGKILGTVWIQGEGDAGAGVSQATYYAALGTMIAQRRTDLSAASSPYVMVTLARNNAGMADASREAIKLAQVQKCADADIYRVDRMDLALHTDGVHHTAAAFIKLGQRCAQAILAANGLAAQYRGPSITSVSQASGTILDVNITHHYGTDFTPSTAITAFRVTDPGAGGAVIAVSSAVRQSASSIRLTLATTPAGTPNVSYLYGSLPSITGIVLDNSALALPLEYNGGLAATPLATSVTVTFESRAGVLRASLAGMKWAFFDQASPGAFTAPVAQGVVETTDGSGVMAISIIGTSLAPGATGWLIVSNSDGTANATDITFSGPVVVA